MANVGQPVWRLLLSSEVLNELRLSTSQLTLKGNFFHAKETYLPIRMKSICRRLGYLICCLQYQLNSKYISKKTRNEMKHKSESWVKRCSILWNTSRLLASSSGWNCQKQFLRKSVFSFYQAIMIFSLKIKMFQQLDTQKIVNSSLQLINLHIQNFQICISTVE